MPVKILASDKVQSWRKFQLMRLRYTVFLCLLVGVHAPSICAKPAAPNIVFILSDDQRWDGLGAAGNPHVKTPNLDRLASEGTHFTQATIHVPQCSPTRASLLTGLSPQRNGWYSNQTQRADLVTSNGFSQYPLLPALLRQAGYDTAFVGKWHLAPDPWNCGFDTVGTWLPGGGGPYQNPRLAKGKSRKSKTEQGFTQELFADSAVEVLKQRSGETSKPLFLWLAFTAPHAPHQPNPKPIEDIYVGKEDSELKPPGFKGAITRRKKAEKKSWQVYYEAISALDSQVGRIQETLKSQGLDKNTVIVFMADNGFMMGSRGLSGKVVPYEDSVRVPLIMWGPEQFKLKGKTDAAASSLDLPPTFLALAGAKAPESWPGRSLSPLLAGEEKHGIDSAIIEFPDNQNRKFGEAGYRVVRTPSHKLIQWNPGGFPPEFYDLKKDPHEKSNLYDDPASQIEKNRLQETLKKWMAKTGDDWSMAENLHRQKEND